MRREQFGWWSERLGMNMPIVRYGHWGPALLWFPTWAANHYEAEDRKIIDVLAPLIEAGRLTVFCIDSINPHAWCNDRVPMHEKSRRQGLYSAYVEEEVVPHIRRVLQDPGARIAAGGASFGAFFAANALCRRPDLFSCVIGMSGSYRLDQVLDGYWDDTCYFNSPEAFVRNMPEGHQLDLLRHHTQIHLLSGRGAFESPAESERFAATLASRGIPSRLDLWGHDIPHDWPTWWRMLQVVIPHRVGW